MTTSGHNGAKQSTRSPKFPVRNGGVGRLTSRPQWYPISALTFPRKTQYDHPLYMRMTGSRNSVPTSMKACVRGDDAASQRVKRKGTIIGKRLIAIPR